MSFLDVMIPQQRRILAPGVVAVFAIAALLHTAEAVAQRASQPARAAEAFIQRNDKNNDGKLSKEEFPDRVRRMFSQVDADKDGFVTLEEDTVFRQSRDQRTQRDERTANRQTRSPNRAGALPEGAKVNRDIVYATIGDRQLRLDLYLPADRTSPVPVVMWIHGGGWRGGQKGSAGPARPLVSRGYAVADVEYRLSGEAIFPAQVEDCKAAVRWLRANAESLGLAADRIGVWGSSAGGHLAAFLGTSCDVKEFDTESNRQYSSRVQAVCDWFGPTDLLKMDAQAIQGSTLVHNGPNSPESLLVGGPIQKEPFRSLAIKANPITYINKKAPPFLIVHGNADLLVSFRQSEQLHAALAKVGANTTLQIVEGAGHGLRNGETPHEQLVSQAGEFFDEHLKSIEPKSSIPQTTGLQPAASANTAVLDNQLGKHFEYSGRLRPRHAREIEASNWSIGAETMDRDFTIYANWREYLGPLGAKKARIQSGWAKTEKKQGVFDWDWMDEIVLDIVDQGVEPWVCLCYGNPIYPGGGDTGLGGGLVSSEEALVAWERYVAAYVTRYKDHVDEWELWNEPRTGRGDGAVQYAKFVVRTAKTIRQLQPRAKIFFAAGGSFDTTFAKQVLEYLREQDKLTLVDAVIYHPYSYNPDDKYEAAGKLRALAKSFASHIDIRQGENGAPSKPGGFGAIAQNDWTEESQAKWAVRRLLGDLGRDIPSSYFAICDMKYPDRINYKGLLAIHQDKSVQHAKLGYYAVQHVTAVFDNTIKRVKNGKVTISGGGETSRYSAFNYRGPGGTSLVTIWRSSNTPGKYVDFEKVKLVVENARFDNPVWLDMLTGRVYAIADSLWTSNDQNTIFTQLPVYDSAIVLAERKALAKVLVTANNGK